MTYFFPSPFIQNEVVDIQDISLDFTVNSGKNALRLVLRSFNLSPGARVGVPAFCCNEVVAAVREERLIPFFFDVSEAGSYWAKYDVEKIKASHIQVIIITHLYGFMHPDTQDIVKWGKQLNLKIIHDAAQSYGMDVSLFKDSPVVYSFGPGKSTTAAKGGEIINISGGGYRELKMPGFWDRIDAQLFYNSRIYGNGRNKIDSIKWRLSQKLKSRSTEIFDMSAFQKQKAMQAKVIVKTKFEERKLRYELLRNAIINSEELNLCYDDGKGLYFKIVCYVKNNTPQLISYLRKNNIPYYRLADDINLRQRELSAAVNFHRTYLNIIEFSTERSIPVNEFERVANLLTDYK